VFRPPLPSFSWPLLLRFRKLECNSRSTSRASTSKFRPLRQPPPPEPDSPAPLPHHMKTDGLDLTERSVLRPHRPRLPLPHEHPPPPVHPFPPHHPPRFFRICSVFRCPPLPGCFGGRNTICFLERFTPDPHLSWQSWVPFTVR